MTEEKKINVLEPIKPLTASEFDALLEEYKKSNPVKYAAKLASGEFDRQRAKLKPEAKPEVKEPKAKTEKNK